jgi:RND family efflux transporter MFP subunit
MMQRTGFPAAARDFFRLHRQAATAAVLVLAGIAVLVGLVKLRKPPARSRPVELPPLVEVQPVTVEDVRMVVRGYGTVKPKVKVEVVPQVAGRVVHVHDEFLPGGFIEAGSSLLKIDPRDYELAVRQARAAVAEAEVRLETEQAEAEVARREWVELHGQAEPSSPLVLRRPQVQQAEAKLLSTRAVLAKAELDLERTDISLPLDVFVTEQAVDLGQFVSTGQRVGGAYGTEVMEIEVPLEDRELAWFDVGSGGIWGNPGAGSGRASEAIVTARLAGDTYSWRGSVTRTAARIDDTTRLIPVVVEVADPFDNSEGRPFLLPGTFVEVAIEGRLARNIIAVPRAAVRGRDRVWVCLDGQLHISRIDIIRHDKDLVYVTGGLADGDMIVLSSLDAATDGMAVRPAGEGGEAVRDAAARPQASPERL